MGLNVLSWLLLLHLSLSHKPLWKKLLLLSANQKYVQKCAENETSALKVSSFVVGAGTHQQELVLSEERKVFIFSRAVWGFYGNQMYIKKILESFPQNSQSLIRLAYIKGPRTIVHMTLSGRTQNDCCATFQIW